MYLHNNSYSEKETADFFAVRGGNAKVIKVPDESGLPAPIQKQGSVSNVAALQLKEQKNPPLVRKKNCEFRDGLSSLCCAERVSVEGWNWVERHNH